MDGKRMEKGWESRKSERSENRGDVSKSGMDGVSGGGFSPEGGNCRSGTRAGKPEIAERAASFTFILNAQAPVKKRVRENRSLRVESRGFSKGWLRSASGRAPELRHFLKHG
jgi:hypothetical protein